MPATPRIQIKRGLKASIPTTGLLAGEVFWTTDTNELFIATDTTTTVPVAISADLLATLSSVSGTEDLMLIYDASEGSAAKLKKMTFNSFKTALNIPAASTDELVAIVSGGTAGYLWGTTGADGVIRMGSTMQWEKDGGNGFATLNVATIDCGTF